MNERTLTVGGLDCAIAESGAGRRPLLLVHGFTGAKEDFTPWLDRLAAAGWHAVAPDLRGHGRSAKPDDELAYSFDIFADDVLGIADALGWDRFVLLGHSMGGMVAQLVAVRAHARLDGLVLMDTGHGPVDGIEPALVQMAVDIVRSGGMDALADALADRTSPLETPSYRRLVETQPGYAEFCDQKLRTSSPAMYASMAPSFAIVSDRLDDLAMLPAALPSLVIVGDEDQPFLEPSRRMAGALAGGSLAVVPDAGHSPQFEHPDAWWTALTGFLESLPAAVPRRGVPTDLTRSS
ncbi:MAG: alpha/beta hydrolase [Acidimicrobiales bacterium]|nr:alpha/beta hydrolase [Acidimicrobiales bacterium]